MSPSKFKFTVWITGSFGLENLPDEAVLSRSEAPVTDARLYLKMRAAQNDSRLRLFREEDRAVAEALGARAEATEGAEPRASFGDLIVVYEGAASGSPRKPVSYFRVRRARFVAFGNDGKRVACVDA